MVTIQVPWSEGSSRYTALFEAEVIAWLKEASVKAVAGRMRLSWNAVEPMLLQQPVQRPALPKLSLVGPLIAPGMPIDNLEAHM